METTTLNFSERINLLRKEIIDSIRSIMVRNNLTEIRFNGALEDPTFILWDDGNGNWYDTPVTAVALAGEGISIDVEEILENVSTTLYSKDLDLAFKNLSWLAGIRNDILEYLKEQGIQYSEENCNEKEEYNLLMANQKKHQKKIESFIISVLTKHGKQSLNLTGEQKLDSNNFPVTATLYARHDTPNIQITDVYCVGESIFADGIESETGGFRREFLIYPEQLSDIMCFIGHVLYLGTKPQRNENLYV